MYKTPTILKTILPFTGILRFGRLNDQRPKPGQNRFLCSIVGQSLNFEFVTFQKRHIKIITNRIKPSDKMLNYKILH